MNPIVAIVGRPNVGKSTLFNRILGIRKAMTLDISGVTRDRHYGHTTWEGRDFICIDTGGLILDEVTSLEKKVNEQVEIAIKEAQVLLFVMEGQSGLLPEEREIAKKLRRSGKKVFYVINKIDGLLHEEKLADFYDLGESLESVSSEHGYKVNDLLDKVVAEFPPEQKEVQKDKKINVALIGRPNVGKSSLLNHLLGESRVIVHDQPGTTRDVIDTPVQVGGQDYLLLDTAGIRRGALSASKVERYSVLNALKALERSDICLVLLDSTEGIHKQDAHIVGYAAEAKKPVILVWNKMDLVDNKRRKELVEDINYRLSFLAYAPVLFVSALTGKGCRDIWPDMRRLYEASGRRISTSQVNAIFQDLISSHNPPVYKGKPLKFFYATQASSFPPTFIVFVSEPTGVHFSFQRYLTNGFRKKLDFEGVPIKIYFRKKR